MKQIGQKTAKEQKKLTYLSPGETKKYELVIEVLKDEKANQDDLVILVSGSGNSNNIIECAEYCNKNNIKLIIECEICGCEGANYIEDFGQSFCEDCEPRCIYCGETIDECLCNSDNTERF